MKPGHSQLHEYGLPIKKTENRIQITQKVGI